MIGKIYLYGCISCLTTIYISATYPYWDKQYLRSIRYGIIWPYTIPKLITQAPGIVYCPFTDKQSYWYGKTIQDWKEDDGW